MIACHSKIARGKLIEKVPEALHSHMYSTRATRCAGTFPQYLFLNRNGRSNLRPKARKMQSPHMHRHQLRKEIYSVAAGAFYPARSSASRSSLQPLRRDVVVAHLQIPTARYAITMYDDCGNATVSLGEGTM